MLSQVLPENLGLAIILFSEAYLLFLDAIDSTVKLLNFVVELVV